jgi:hypothetical protein
MRGRERGGWGETIIKARSSLGGKEDFYLPSPASSPLAEKPQRVLSEQMSNNPAKTLSSEQREKTE